MPPHQTRKHRVTAYHFAAPEYKRYSLAVGQVALAWNYLHEVLGMLFLTLLKQDHSDEQHWAIWNGAKFDRPKRQLLLGVVTNLPEADRLLRPKAAGDLKWLVDRVDALEEDRNNAVHSPLLLVGKDARAKAGGRLPRVVPVVIFGNARAQKLETKDLLAEFKLCRDTAAVLAHYAAEIERHFSQTVNFLALRDTWPPRPSLPNRGQKKLLKKLGPREP